MHEALTVHTRMQNSTEFSEEKTAKKLTRDFGKYSLRERQSLEF